MTAKDMLELAALLLSPVVAVVVGQWIQNRHGAEERRANIFRTLMACRATPIHIDRVRALNIIDVEFAKYPDVLEAWSKLFEVLNERGAWTEERGRRAYDGSTALLAAIATSLGYRLVTDITRRAYIPTGHADFDADWFAIRKSVVAITKGEGSLPIVVTNAMPHPPLVGDPQQATPPPGGTASLPHGPAT